MSSPSVTPQLDDVRSLPVHLFMPPSGVPFEPAAYEPLPVVGQSVVIVSFKVPAGMNGVIQRIANVYVGAGFTEGDGSLQWQILQNGGAVRNFENIAASLGLVQAPSTISGILVKEGQLIQLVCNNISLGGGGAQVGGRLGGYFYPVDLEPQDAWL